MRKQTYNFVLSPGIKDALEIAAKKDRRSMSSLLEKIIIDHLEKEGIPWTNGHEAGAPAKAGRTRKSVEKK